MVLHRDDHLVVVDKPAGIVVHRGWAREDDVLMMRPAVAAWFASSAIFLVIATPSDLALHRDNPGLIYGAILLEGREVYAA